MSIFQDLHLIPKRFNYATIYISSLHWWFVYNYRATSSSTWRRLGSSQRTRSLLATCDLQEVPFLSSVLGSSECWVRGSIRRVRSAEMFLPQLQWLQENYDLNTLPHSTFEQIFCHPPTTPHNFIGTADIWHLVYIIRSIAVHCT